MLENVFLSLGLSWSFSKVFPFICVFSVFCFCYLFVRKKAKKPLKITLVTLMFLAPLIYFAIYPIYEGDFANQSNQIRDKMIDAQNNDLVVFAIPNCPFCKESISKINRLAERNPSLSIAYIVVNSDNHSLDAYRKLLRTNIHLRLTKDIPTAARITDGKFPTFFYKQNEKTWKKWHNSGFGTLALDEIESYRE